MLELPESILNYLLRYYAEDRAPGYISIDTNGCLLTWGGNLERYDVTRLRKGEPISEQVPFLQGLLPLGGSSGFVMRMKTESGVAVELHLFSASDGDWVLFLDATQDEAERRATQQRLNDLRLMVEHKQT